MVYLDNAATSFPKPNNVITGMEKCLREYCANPGRGSYEMAIKSSSIIWETRVNLAGLFQIKKPERIVFTKNATEAINIGLKGLLKQGDHVITTSMEHNSVIRPLKKLEKDNIIELTVIPCGPLGEFDVKNLKNYIKPNTKLLICTVCSNVNGTIMPINEIGKIIKQKATHKDIEKDIIYFLDASQGAGSMEINVEESGIDLMAFPGHKGLMGPQGTGGLYVSENIILDTIMEGGTGTDSKNIYQPLDYPEYLESGTLNTPGIAGLNEGIKFIKQIGIAEICRHKERLAQKIYEELKKLKKAKLYTKENCLKSGIISFNFDGVDASEVAFVLDKAYYICARAGLHCAPLAHETLGTKDIGCLRLSIGYFNTEKDIMDTIYALKEIHQHLEERLAEY